MWENCGTNCVKSADIFKASKTCGAHSQTFGRQHYLNSGGWHRKSEANAMALWGWSPPPSPRLAVAESSAAGEGRVGWLGGGAQRWEGSGQPGSLPALNNRTRLLSETQTPTVTNPSGVHMGNPGSRSNPLRDEPSLLGGVKERVKGGRGVGSQRISCQNSTPLKRSPETFPYNVIFDKFHQK